MGKIFTAYIPEMNLQGNGIVRLDGCVVFVLGAVDGDTVTAEITEEKKNFKIARIISVDTPSPHRINSDCPAFPTCGGCHLRCITYSHELEIKRAGVEAALRRGGLGTVTVPEIISTSPECYRNKAVFRFSHNGYGFSQEKTDNVVSVGNCLICPEVFSAIAEFTFGFFGEIKPAYLYLRRSSLGEISVVLGFDGDISSYADALTAEFPSVTGVMRKTGNHPEDKEKTELVFGKDFIEEKFLDLSLKVSPESFFQVNHAAAELLCKKVSSYAAPEGLEFGADLYCGTGIIGLSIASLCPKAMITGVEINPFAVENAKENALRNNLSNIGFFCGDSAEFVKKIYGSIDFITIDPPRAGCSDSMIKELLHIKPQRLVYVSCDPSTLARDLKRLCDGVYKIESITAADLFPRTKHVETVVLMSRNKE